MQTDNYPFKTGIDSFKRTLTLSNTPSNWQWLFQIHPQTNNDSFKRTPKLAMTLSNKLSNWQLHLQKNNTSPNPFQEGEVEVVEWRRMVKSVWSSKDGEAQPNNLTHIAICVKIFRHDLLFWLVENDKIGLTYIIVSAKQYSLHPLDARERNLGTVPNYFLLLLINNDLGQNLVNDFGNFSSRSKCLSAPLVALWRTFQAKFRWW